MGLQRNIIAVLLVTLVTVTSMLTTAEMAFSVSMTNDQYPGGSATFYGNVAAPDQAGCVYFTAIAESNQWVQQPDAPNRFALYHLPQNYPQTGAVVITGFEGDPYPLVGGISSSYFQTPQCVAPVIYVLTITSNGGLMLNPSADSHKGIHG
jgi:hypothetical protein